MLRATQELDHPVSQLQLPRLYHLLQKEQDEICFAIICVITTCATQMSWAEVTAGFGVRGRNRLDFGYPDEIRVRQNIR